MTADAVIFCAGFVLFFAAFVLVIVGHERQQRAWTREREMLLERIQRPERVLMHQEVPELAPLETDGDELAKLGQIFPEDD